MRSFLLPLRLFAAMAWTLWQAAVTFYYVAPRMAKVCLGKGLWPWMHDAQAACDALLDELEGRE